MQKKKSHIELISVFNQENWKDQLCKIFVNLNLLFWIVDNE